MIVTVKPWIYKEAQAKAQKYNFTLIWDRVNFYVGDPELAKAARKNPTEEIIDRLLDEKNFTEAYTLVGDITRETEKAIMLECKYWNLNRAGRYVTDAPVCKGFKVWIPKTAVLKTKETKKEA